jgi:lysozyme family protein
MADAKQVIDFVMRQEDSTLSGVITNKPTDRGGCTRFGLTERWHPELAEQGFFETTLEDGKPVPKMPATEALALAEKTYDAEYDAPLSLAAISSQALATALLSLAVLEGTREAVTLLQKAINVNTPLTIDGLMGPKTLALANAADPAKLRNALVSFGEGYFQHLAQVVPSQAANLAGWMNRAKALLAIAIPVAQVAQAPTTEPEAEPATA